MAAASLKPHHDALPVAEAARLSGLSPDVIRIWERRYRVVSPHRGPRGARLYDGDDIDRLRLLRQVVQRGRRIGDVSCLSTQQLEALARRDVRREQAVAQNGHEPRTRDSSHAAAIRLFDALERFDAAALEQGLGESLAALGGRGFVREVAIPLLVHAGECWERGTLSIAAEHLVSGLIRNLLGAVVQSRVRAGRPRILLATPTGERHELGLVMVALLALQRGFCVYCLGAEVPALEIVDAARRGKIHIVGIGLAHGRNRRRAVEEVRTLARALPASMRLWLGGADAGAVSQSVRSRRLVVLSSLERLEQELERAGATHPRRGKE